MGYGKTNIDKARNEADRIRRSEHGIWKPKDGENSIRVMPPWSDDVDTFFVQGGAHFNVGPQGKVFSCPRQADSSAECWLCDLVERLDAGDEADRQEAADLRVRKSWMVNVVDLKDPGAGVRVWKAGVKAFKQLLEYIEDPDYGDITDPDAGYNIKVTKSGKNLNTDYLVRCAKNPSAFDFPEMLDELNDLEAFLNYEPAETMEAAFNGLDAPDDGDENDPTPEEFDGDENAPPGFDEEETEEAVEEEEPAAAAEEEAEAPAPVRRPAPVARPAAASRPAAPRPPASAATRPIKPAARPIPPKPPAAGGAVRRALGGRPAPRK